MAQGAGLEHYTYTKDYVNVFGTNKGEAIPATQDGNHTYLIHTTYTYGHIDTYQETRPRSLAWVLMWLSTRMYIKILELELLSDARLA